MPEEYDSSFSLGLIIVPFDGFIDSSIIIGSPLVPRVMGRVILHVEASDHRYLSSFADKLIIIEGSLS
jgi:hypothetical protein